MEHEAFKEHYDIEISEIKYIDIIFTNNLAFQKLKFPVAKLSVVSYPLLPTLIGIALSTKKAVAHTIKF